MTGFDQRCMSAGVEPCKATVQNLHEQIAALHVGAIDVGDLQFAAG